MEALLHNAGYAVIKANREVFLKEIAGIRPDLAILDYLLPYGFGNEKCVKIKTNLLTADIPVILYCASEDIERKVMESKADAFIAKPFDIEKLKALIVATIR